MSDQQIDNILEHFGIRGMRWGVRNQPQNLDRVNRVARGTELRKKSRRQLAARVAIVGGAVGATAVVSAILARRGMVSMAEAKRLSNATAAKHLMSIRGHVKMNAIHDVSALRGLKDFASKV